MDPEVKKAWIEALRNPKYAQCRLCLRESFNSFCATGLLLFILEPDAWTYDGRWRIGPRNTACDPWEVIEKYPWSKHIKGKIYRVAGLNDRGHDFGQLATWIEANL